MLLLLEYMKRCIDEAVSKSFYIRINLLKAEMKNEIKKAKDDNTKELQQIQQDNTKVREDLNSTMTKLAECQNKVSTLAGIAI